ncbi:MAG: DUF3015 family protein [Elusimicrobia bacterium]|nr:DUF3015 family protein [Elusimicrobiota bacterium]
MKKTILITLLVLAAGSAAYALGDNDANIGCGWGTTLFKGQTDKKIPALLGATTNGTYTQTFGISSETAGCTVKGGLVINEKKQATYAEANIQKLSTEMAQGGGEYLSAFATLMGAKNEQTKKAFFELTQKNYSTLFPTANTDSATMLKNLRALLATNPNFATL